MRDAHNVKIGKIRGATYKSIAARQFNIYIGVSLGNRWFSDENLRIYLQWALAHTKERVCLLLADTLHAINYEVKEKKKPEAARRKALRKGDEMERRIRTLLEDLTDEERQRTEILRWDALMRDEEIQHDLTILTREFCENKDFHDEIIAIVRSYLSNSWIAHDETKVRDLARYILTELPEHIKGFRRDDIHYNCHPYPYDSRLTLFVEKLQNGQRFPHLHHQLQMRTNAFVELKTSHEQTHT